MSGYQEISLEEWFETYKPIPVPSNITDYNCGNIDGRNYGIETFGDNFEYLRSVAQERPDCIWTFHDDGESSWIGNGLHYVDRLYHFVTEIPCPEGVHITADLDNYADELDYDEDEEEEDLSNELPSMRV
jgi:hypothetical protein